ncbi:hypothetical protein DV515_00004793, partial [Chloebia gouldiae]
MGGVVLEGLCTGRENTEIKLHCCEPKASSVAVLTPFKHSSVPWCITDVAECASESSLKGAKVSLKS